MAPIDLVYDSLLKVEARAKGSGSTLYPDCTGLIVNIPRGEDGDHIAGRVTRQELIDSGKIVMHGDANGDPVMSGLVFGVK